MSSMTPVGLYGLEVPPGEVLVPVSNGFPATIRITMAAIDPTEDIEDENGAGPSTRVARSTLKLVKQAIVPPEEDSDEDSDDEALRDLLLANSDSDDEDEDDEEANGGPSDKAKTKKASAAAALKQLLESAQDEEDSDEDMDDEEQVKPKVNGAKANKGKGKSKELVLDDESDDEEDEDYEDELAGLDLEAFVVCTLDTERNYQQTIEITVGDDEKAFFIVSGTHTIHLTGNYVIDADNASDDEDDYDEDEDDEDYMDFDLPPGIEASAMDADEDESEEDELDALGELARVEEVDTDEEEAPKLVAQASKKASKKRPAEDEATTNGAGLDDLIEKDAKLSKKQAKKLKNNEGKPVAAAAAKDDAAAKEAAKSAEKKVQFAKNLEQGPTGSTAEAKPAAGKGALGVKVVQGVTIDDRKLGSGRVAKKGDKVSMRYIGKFADSMKVFDANKKGPGFSFQIGKGEVIKGWDIGIAGMAVKGERRLTIPANLAYGSKGTAGIPGNSTLIFDVKLLEIK